MFLSSYFMLINGFITVWKVSKYGVFSHPYFPAFGPEKTPYLDTFDTVYISEIWASEFVLISCMRLSHRKNTQSVKSAWSICIQSSKLGSFTLSREIMKKVKQTHTFWPESKSLTCLFYKRIKIPDQAQVCLQKYGL